MSHFSVFQDQSVSVVQDSRDSAIVWYRTTDVCRVLGFKNPAIAVENNCRKKVRQIKIGPGRAANYIQRSDVLRLIFASKSECAEIFQDWVLDEVLPKVFDNGAYISPAITPEQGEAAKREIDRILAQPDPWQRLVSVEMLDLIHEFYGQFCGESFWWRHIYCWLTADERCKLDRLNPINPLKMQRETRIHQWIEGEQETKQRLRTRVVQVLAVLESATSKEDFEIRLSRIGGKNQLELSM